jgi:hypothetical protein
MVALTSRGRFKNDAKVCLVRMESSPSCSTNETMRRV